MRHEPSRFMFSDVEPARVELVLSARDGSPWSLTMSAGTERFIGQYPRLGEMVAAGPLLAYRPVYPAA